LVVEQRRETPSSRPIFAGRGDALRALRGQQKTLAGPAKRHFPLVEQSAKRAVETLLLRGHKTADFYFIFLV
jgi:hypothetical protein